MNRTAHWILRNDEGEIDTEVSLDGAARFWHDGPAGRECGTWRPGVYAARVKSGELLVECSGFELVELENKS